jgi:23S rRNA pseudouridine955/2504/2580 synthase
LREGDVAKLFLSDETIEKFSSGEKNRDDIGIYLSLYKVLENNPYIFPVVYENCDIIIFNKPSGMLSQKAVSSDISANDYLLAYLAGRGEIDASTLTTFHPSIANRLDRNTSGLICAGKTLKGSQMLGDGFKNRTIKKYYRCVVSGIVEVPSHIEGYLIKDELSNTVEIYGTMPQKTTDAPAKKIITDYRPIRSFKAGKSGHGHGDFTELEVHLVTGKTHQIRAHLASQHHPIIGDPKYGDAAVNRYFKKTYGITHQMLHAYRMEFPDGLIVSAPCADAFEALH